MYYLKTGLCQTLGKTPVPLLAPVVTCLYVAWLIDTKPDTAIATIKKSGPVCEESKEMQD